MKHMSHFDDDREFCSSPLKDSTNRANRRKAVRKRKRKSSTQLEILIQEFQLSSEWDRQQISRIIKKTGLTEAQIYKWGWDQKKKSTSQIKIEKKYRANLDELYAQLPEAKFTKKEVDPAQWGILSCAEALVPPLLDFHFYRLQKSYKELSDEFKRDSTYKGDTMTLLYIRV